MATTNTAPTTHDCDDCRDTGRVLILDEEIPCECCDAGRRAAAEDCEYCHGEGLCDDGSYNRVVCQCPAGEDLADAELSARDSVADHSRRLGLGSSVRWV